VAGSLIEQEPNQIPLTARVFLHLKTFVFLKKKLFFLFFSNYFFIFLFYFDMLISKIIFKK
jgi:hypothetical protein